MNYLVFDDDGELSDVIDIASDDEYNAYLLRNPNYALILESEYKEGFRDEEDDWNDDEDFLDEDFFNEDLFDVDDLDDNSQSS